ncbi:DUF2339 domain-containing protein [Gemmobacter denitrificans]|uniref:DUF2339 domain-containing protein n=1 Tax=Gemmobacter denitrificans TaxID=3123040 RepID=A0ABU8BUD7_9RHOB
MEAMLMLLGLALLAVPVGLILLVISHIGLRRRVDALEAQLAKLDPAPQGTEAIAVKQVPKPSSPAAPALPTMADPLPPAVPSPWDRALPGGSSAPVSTEAEAKPAPAAPAISQDQPLVLRRDRLAELAGWLRDNWVYAVAALSLALAGVFFVQYGVERGLLPPPARVALAILFGLALIAAGEAVRRRWGDGAEMATAYLPSVFSGAGIVAVFAGVAAGRLMYGLYGPGLAFAGLALAAMGAIALGWRHGPLLVAVGLIGAAATPFLVDGGGGAVPWLYGHYLLVAFVGLAVDAFRRWAWVSVLALALAHLGLWLMAAGGAGDAGWLWSLVGLALMAIILPQRSLMPDHDAPSVLRRLWQRDGVWPAFPVRLAFGNTVVVVAVLTLAMPDGAAGLLAFLLLAALAVGLLLWADRAQGLEDLAPMAAVGFLAKLVLAQPMVDDFAAAAIALRAPETAAPGTVSLLLALAVAISAACALRARAPSRLAEAFGAIFVAPAAVLLLDLIWQPVPVIGAFPWALQVISVAAGMVALAVIWARNEGAPGRRSAWAILAALSLIALALFVLTSAAALTLALAVLLVAAAALDRRFNLPEMGWFLQAGAAVLSWRLVADPGLDWALDADLVPVLASYLAVAGACAAGLWLLRPDLPAPRAVLESLGLASVALLANVLLARLLAPEPLADGWTPDWSMSHWGLTLNAMPWLILCLSQLWRAAASTGWVQRGRFLLAGLAGVLAAGGLVLAVFIASPLHFIPGDGPTGQVIGPILINSLALAYLLPGLMLLGVGRMLGAQSERRSLRALALIPGSALVILWAVLTIRHFWQGPWLGLPAVGQGELYSYTVALLLTGAVLLWQALARRSDALQRMAMLVIGLTVAKVFLWDAAGLTGLTRVVSFAGLGLSLAGLAWLNRWARGALSEPRDGV